MGEDKCQLCEFKVEKLQQELTEFKADMKDRIETIEETQKELGDNNIKMDITLKNFGEKFSKIEFSLDSIVSELKGIGDKLLMLKVKEELAEVKEVTQPVNAEDDKAMNLVGKMVSGNNKTLYFVIFIMAIALLFSMGMNVDDILKFLGK